MRTLRIQFPVQTMIDDERTGDIQVLTAGSVMDLDYDVAIGLLLQADPLPHVLSPLKLRSGFLVHWLEADGEPGEGKLILECAFLEEERLEEWLLVEQRGTGKYITRSQLVGWDPAPMIEAIRQVYRASPSDRVPLLAESCLRGLLDTQDEGTNYQPIRQHGKESL